MRHGQTVSNNASCFNNKDESLNSKGRLQAQAAAKRLETENYDLIICSPLPRTRQTLASVLKDRVVKVEYWETLAEIDWGRLQGAPYLPHQEAFSGIDQGLYAESLEDLELRAISFWKALGGRSEERILIVSHGAIMCILFAVNEGLGTADFEHYRFNVWQVMGNCDVKNLVIE